MTDGEWDKTRCTHDPIGARIRITVHYSIYTCDLENSAAKSVNSPISSPMPYVRMGQLYPQRLEILILGSA